MPEDLEKGVVVDAHSTEDARKELSTAARSSSLSRDSTCGCPAVDVLHEQQRQQHDQDGPQSVYKNLGWLDRLLVVWIFLAIVVGMLIGNFVPSFEDFFNGKVKLVSVDLPIAIGLLVMMYPILCKVKYEELHKVFATRQVWYQLGFSVLLNWIIAPFFMLGLAWAFLPDEMGLRQGLILVGIARCIAMVLVWTGLAGGDENYCAILVAFNSILQMVLFAPMSIFFLKTISHGGDELTIDYSTVASSVGVFLGIPLGAAILTRLVVRSISARFYDRYLLKFLAPWSLLGLLYTVIILFASQGKRVVHQIVSVVRVAAPLIVYFLVIFFATVYVAHKLGFGYKLSATQGFTAASNNFELAIAIAIATFGINSDAALATTVGPLIEVPVLLSLVYVLRWIARRRSWS